VCPHCHNNSFYLIPGTTRARCMCCGIEGDITVDKGAFKFNFDTEKWLGPKGLAHDTIPGKFHHADDIHVMEDKLIEIKKTNPVYKERQDKYRAFIKGTKPAK
jgi:glutamate 5-kinase